MGIKYLIVSLLANVPLFLMSCIATESLLRLFLNEFLTTISTESCESTAGRPVRVFVVC